MKTPEVRGRAFLGIPSKSRQRTGTCSFVLGNKTWLNVGLIVSPSVATYRNPHASTKLVKRCVQSWVHL